MLGRRFLVVDSNPDSCLQTGGLLAELGANVDVAGSGAEALSLLQQPGVAFDAILVALRLSDMNGVEFLQRVQQLPRPVPVVLLLEYGWDPGPLIAKARAQGLSRDGMLLKPLMIPKLRACLERLLGGPSGTES